MSSIYIPDDAQGYLYRSQYRSQYRSHVFQKCYTLYPYGCARLANLFPHSAKLDGTRNPHLSFLKVRWRYGISRVVTSGIFFHVGIICVLVYYDGIHHHE